MKNQNHPAPRLLAVLVASTLGWSAQVQAQADAAAAPAVSAAAAPVAVAPAAEAESDRQTVMVTGTRRRTPVLEVPMAVNAISAEELARRGAEQLSEYVDSLPGVTLNSGGGRGMDQVSIRGVTIGGDINPPTSTYLDDIPYGGSDHNGAKMSLDMGALDLHHIEIYRGPQGTLYGANALGGVVKYVFNEPNVNETTGYLRGDVSSTRHGGVTHMESAVVNVPLSQGVAALRAGASHTSNGGYVNAVGPLPGERSDRGTADSYRVAALFAPSRDLSIKLTALQQKLKRDGNNATAFTLAGQPVYGEDRYARGAVEPFEQTVRVGSLELDYDLKWARLNAVLSDQTSDNRVVNDYSAVYVPVYGAYFPMTAAWADTIVNTRKKTAELRLTSPRSSQFEWLAGLFANDEKSELFQNVDTLNGAVAGTRLIATTMPSTFREAAAFGDVTFYPAPALGLTLGARASRNKQHFRQSIESPLAPSLPDRPTEATDTSRTWLATARYTLAPKSSVYVRVATGYNPGGVNAYKLDPGSGATLTEHPTYEANTLLSTEMGYKADLLDGRLALEAALYRLDWKDIQLVRSTGSGGEIVNGGKARVNGAEFSATFRPVDGWSIAPSFAYIDGTSSEDIPELGALEGDRLPVTPKWSGALRVTREFTLAGHPAHAGLNWRYVGERDSNFVHSTGLNAPNYVLPSYSTFGLNAGVEYGATTVNVYVRNLTDKRGQLAATTGLALYGQPALVSLSEPRTIGVNVQYSF